MRSYDNAGSKRIYYLSLEFLMGRTLRNSLLNMDVDAETRRTLDAMGIEMERIEEEEPDAALGNGGLGRLAACFLDSMATLRLPGFGYGIRYEYGMFNQRIENGYQVEHPEAWLRYGNPWEFPRADVLYPVSFHGRVASFRNSDGRLHFRWTDTQDIMAMAYDVLIPAYGSNTVNSLRLWSAKASRDFALQYFNEGNYIKAVADQVASENLSRVLYPSDTTAMGRELRLQQEYFFVSASLQDILARHLRHHESLRTLPDMVAIQLNDTHPSIAIPELMRLLLDRYEMDWEPAWDITVRTFSYTNHTLMPEALETWPVDLIETMLPRHLQIIYEINRRLLERVHHRYPGDAERLRRMSLIDERGRRRVRMAYLAVVGSHKVNGVSAIHTELMRESIFRDFDQLDADKIINVTNGITPRRWLHQINPGLSDLISEHIGRGWISRLERLQEVAPLAENREFVAAFRDVKHANKTRLAGLIGQRLKIPVRADSLFDVQIKRMHEYKRQVLNLLHVIALYNRLRRRSDGEPVPRTVIFSGKAAPSYTLAKLTIKAINDVADVIDQDPAVDGLLRVVFIPNYDVTTAGDIIPAAELSEQISLAGTEASGTGNMKLALNGALTIGTLDGANIEIREHVGDENIFIFGQTAAEAARRRNAAYRPKEFLRDNDELAEIIDMLAGGYFSPGQPERFKPLVESLTTRDPFMVLADYASYAACQLRAEEAYRDCDGWTRRAIRNVAAMGYFSSDRTIEEYAEKIWNVAPVTPD
jgi:starch phosphorylase